MIFRQFYSHHSQLFISFLQQKYQKNDLLLQKNTPMTINEIQEQIISDFEWLESREERYNHIIELGKALSIDDKDKIDENIIKGCQSKVWLIAEKADQNLVFRADSDALIVKGIVALLLKVLSGHTPKEILNADLYFLEKIGLHQLLSMNRSNGLTSMVKQMKYYALAFDSMPA